MNKKILLPVMALALSLASCDMDKEPYNAIPDGEALQTPSDFLNMSTSLYTGFRGAVYGSAFCNAPDMQSDDFNSTFGTGVSDLYGWTFNTSLREGDSMYGSCQGMIANANFIIDGYNRCDMSNTNLFTEEGIQQVRNVKGEAFFTRAYFLFYLAQYFCADYEESTADEPNSGASYRTDYYPSSDASTYPGRNTLRQTYKQINDDLDSAALYISREGSQSSYYVTQDAITAMEARVALAMDDYATAIQKAEALINSQTYTLANSASRMQGLWWGNIDTESIFKIYAQETDQLPTQTGSIYLPYMTGGSPSYIPTQTVVNLFDDADYRKDVYFMGLSMTTATGISGNIQAFCKFPEQGYIYNQTKWDYARFCIEPKVSRISEMYLIAAEAYAKQGTNWQQGATLLNNLKRTRIAGYADETFASADALMDEIMEERHREFLGEGMRLLDLKRWHLGVTRGTPQQENLCSMPGLPTTTALSKPADDYHFTWPIPQNEIDTNPKIVQNPGYSN